MFSRDETIGRLGYGRDSFLCRAVRPPSEPGSAGDHAEPAKEASGVTDLLVVDQQVPLREENLPVMVTGADERKRKCTGVCHVRANVEKIFEEPKAAEGDAGRFALEEKIEETGQWDD